MGNLFSSRANTEAIETIEANVIELRIRGDEEEILVDYYVKEQILNGLNVYKDQINKELTKGCISSKKALRLKDSICTTTTKFEAIATKKYELKNIDIGEKVYVIKDQLLEIKKYVKSNEFDENHCKNVSRTFTLCAQRASKIFPEKKSDDELSILFLEIFLNLPKTKISTVLTKNVTKLNEIIEDFEIIKMDNMDPFNIEETECMLKETKSKIKVIDGKIEKGLNHVEVSDKSFSHKQRTHKENNTGQFHRTGWNYNVTPPKDSTNQKKVRKHNLQLEKIDKELIECEKMINELCPPVGDKTISNLKNKMNILVAGLLQKIVSTDLDIDHKKTSLNKKGMQIITKLESIETFNNQLLTNLKKLKDVEDKLYLDVESKLSFKEKKQSLDTHWIVINAINENNSEVEIRKNEILNKIYGFLLVEVFHHLRQLNDSLNRYKMYAQQFPFPSQIQIYRYKREEIQTLETLLYDVPKDIPCVGKRVRRISHQISELLHILDEKSKDNDGIISSIEHLELLKRQIVNTDSALTLPLDKLHLFNKHRREKDLITNGTDNRIVARKMEIVSLLQTCEEKILIFYPKEAQEMKAVLNQHEKSTFIHPISSEKYHQENAKITKLREDLQAGVYRQSINDDLGIILSNTAELILKLLENNAKCCQKEKELIENLNTAFDTVNGIIRSNLHFGKKVKHLTQKVNEVNAMRNFTKNSEMLKKIVTMEQRLIAERSKIELEYVNTILKIELEDIKKLTYPINPTTFQDKLCLMLSLKDNVDDMSEDNPELDAQKQKILQNLFTVMQRLDETVARAANSRDQSKDILELGDHFNDFNPDAFTGPKNSLGFVQMIYERSRSFEERVRFYLGTSYSVDYYVIHENLLRLLEELDKLTCADDEQLLKEVVRVMDYIKGLIIELDSKCCDD